jgi:hypothetical protein
MNLIFYFTDETSTSREASSFMLDNFMRIFRFHTSGVVNKYNCNI